MSDEQDSSRLAWVYVIIVSFMVAGASFALPVPDTVTNPLATHWRTFASVLLTCLFVASSVVFLRSISSLKPGARAAYRFLAFGLLALSVTLLQFIFWSTLDLWTSAWADSGSGLLPIAIACILIYAGTRRLSKTLGIRSITNSFWFTAGVTLVVSAIMYVLAGMYVQYEFEGIELYIAICTLGSVFLFFATLVTAKITRRIGAYYANAMRWLTIALGALCFETSHEAINTFWFNNGDTYTDYGYYLIPFVIAGILMVRASYAFRSLPVIASSTPVMDKGLHEAPATTRDYVDSIVAVAGMVSRPEDIDTVLDELRLMAVGNDHEAELSEHDKSRLLKTYYLLETYLREKDTVRTFTREEILNHVTPPFRSLILKSAK